MSGSRSFDPYAVFQRSVERWPGRPALCIGARVWTYAELEIHAASLAGWCDAHTPPASRIAVHGAKDLLAYAGILGVLRSGRSYVPLHPQDPSIRWSTILGLSSAAGLIAQVPLDTHMPCCSSSTLGSTGSIRIGSEAYLMFTSGTTGGPKGVPVSRGNVAAYLEHMLTRYAFTEEERFTQLFALTFDLSVHDLFVCWGSGACLCVPEDESALHIRSYVEQSRITVWFSVPSLAALMKRMRQLTHGSLPTLKRSFFCGEALPWELASEWHRAAPNTTITNLYGPTEATIAITAFDLDKGHDIMEGTVPLGRPIGENVIRVHEADVLGQGELLLSGPQVTSGYLDRPDATSSAFIHLEDGTRTWYRTGDRVRMDADGVIHFHGRMDDQVKVLGHRVEPAEIDGVLRPWVPSGNVLTLPYTKGGATRLITFIDVDMDVPSLLDRSRRELPAYMVPERIITVTAFPTTPHGKVDRNALMMLAGDE